MVVARSMAGMDRPSSPQPSQTLDGLDDDDMAERLPPGTRFGRYEVRRLLGHGAFGAVYEAQQHEPLQRTVALKVLHDVARTSPQLVARFMREAQIAASIAHPHIVTVFDIGTEGNVPYIAMERLHGEALEALLDRQRVLTPTQTVDVLLPILSAVAAVHDAGIVHRDLKPANLFLSTPRPGAVVPKLLDFGIVKVLDRTASAARTETRAFLGTPHYTSPEQAMDSSTIGTSSDQWSLGVILYECLTGTRPWCAGPVLKVLFEITSAEIKPPSSVRSSIPRELDAVVMRALSRPTDERFASVRQLGGALLPFASEAVRSTWRGEFESHAPKPVVRPPPQLPQLAPDPAPVPRARVEPQLAPDPELAARPRTPPSRSVPKAKYGDLQPAPPPPAPPPRWLWPVVAVVALTLAAIGFMALRSPSTPAPIAAPPVTVVTPPEPDPPPTLPPPAPSPPPAPVVVAPPVPVPAPLPVVEPVTPREQHPRRRTHPAGDPPPASPTGGIPNV